MERPRLTQPSVRVTSTTRTEPTQKAKTMHMDPDTRFCDPYPSHQYPTFDDCQRCGRRLPERTNTTHCPDCKLVRTRNRPELPSTFTTPPFDITCFNKVDTWKGITNTVRELRAAQITHWHRNMYADGVSLVYLRELVGHIPTTITTITEPGRLLDYWEGDNVDKIREWIARAQQPTHALAA